MELAEDIDRINYQLLKRYGREEFAQNQQRFRVVFSEDQFEKRFVTHTKDGFELPGPIVMEVPKYRQYIHGRYVLERLVPVAEDSDLVTEVSYEPMHVFQTSEKRGHIYLPPRFDMCEVFIESLLSAAGKKNTFAKYKDPNDSKEERAKKLDDLKRELFGNETPVGDALAYDYGTVVPRKFEKTVVVSETQKEE